VVDRHWEFWFYVKCKSPDCVKEDRRILLDKAGTAQRPPFEPLPADALGIDWKEHCPWCLTWHTYSKGDVKFSDAMDMSTIPAGEPSPAFRRAWSHKPESVTPVVF
jgi:hypothetical protein